ncbi:c-type heme family protein [Urbifossiella limnaea]|uniref:Tll0287-like domain-containing protein n=1 Tax=Urbifossiella limnaea TaxID=2528023 RepID=A0A517XXV3_9BACT|nr:DUF3365 domain-containing protein [Urbifossiella limnaea]QDU22339.1 hypothetical protein ETAA1_43170 [Urbifossiella limnaea]
MSASTRTGLAAGLFVLPLALAVSPTRADEEGADRRVPVAVARDRAKLAHEVYVATLDSMHHHFFRRDRAVLPARALEDVFTQVGRRTGVEAKWIAVNTPAMSTDHEPKTAFEKEAAAAIAAGKDSYERVEGGVYRRAGAIPLGTGCVSCHTRFATAPDKTPRFAGLVLGVPLKGE